MQPILEISKGKEFCSDKKSEVVEQLDHYKALVRFGEKFSSKMSVREYGLKYLYHKEKQIKRGTFLYYYKLFHEKQ